MGFRIGGILLAATVLLVPLTAAQMPAEAEEHLDSGFKHLRKKKYEKVIVELEKARELADGLCERCLQGLGMAYSQLGKDERAVEVFEQLFVLSPGESVDLLFRLVSLYESAGQFDKAVETYQTFVEHAELADHLVPAYNRLGILLLAPSVKRHEEAELAFDNALKLTGGKANAVRKNLAETLWRLGREEDALALLDGLVEPIEDDWPRLEAVGDMAEPVAEKGHRVTAVRQEEAAAPRRVGGDVKPPKKIRAPQPDFSDIDRNLRGNVIGQAIIDAEGRVTEVKILQGISRAVDQRVVDVISKWRFKPATLNGKPVSVYYGFGVGIYRQ